MMHTRVRKEMVAQDKKQEEQIDEIKGALLSVCSPLTKSHTFILVYIALLQQAIQHEIIEHLRNISSSPFLVVMMSEQLID